MSSWLDRRRDLAGLRRLDVSVGKWFVQWLIGLLLILLVEGTEIWVAAENAYNERVPRAEK